MEMKVPEFVTRVFAAKELETEDATIVVLDRLWNILWVNSAWERFAKENDSGPVASVFGVGTNYLQGISGELRAFYADVFAEILHSKSVWRQSYECSSSKIYRMMQLRVLAVGEEGLLLEHSLRLSHPHETSSLPADFSEQAYRDENGIVLQCSNCRRVHRVGDGWHWIESWVAVPPAATSHGLCGPCAALYVMERKNKRALRAKEKGE